MLLPCLCLLARFPIHHPSRHEMTRSSHCRSFTWCPREHYLKTTSIPYPLTRYSLLLTPTLFGYTQVRFVAPSLDSSHFPDGTALINKRDVTSGPAQTTAAEGASAAKKSTERFLLPRLQARNHSPTPPNDHAPLPPPILTGLCALTPFYSICNLYLNKKH